MVVSAVHADLLLQFNDGEPKKRKDEDDKRSRGLTGVESWNTSSRNFVPCTSMHSDPQCTHCHNPRRHNPMHTCKHRLRLYSSCLNLKFKRKEPNKNREEISVSTRRPLILPETRLYASVLPHCRAFAVLQNRIKRSHLPHPFSSHLPYGPYSSAAAAPTLEGAWTVIPTTSKSSLPQPQCIMMNIVRSNSMSTL